MSAIAFNIDAADFNDIADFVESVGGEFGVTHEGRLVGSGVDAAKLVESQPFEKFYLSLVDDETIGFEF